MIQTLRIGTRGSPLALAQARMVATALRDAHDWGPERIEIMPIAHACAGSSEVRRR